MSIRRARPNSSFNRTRYGSPVNSNGRVSSSLAFSGFAGFRFGPKEANRPPTPWPHLNDRTDRISPRNPRSRHGADSQPQSGHRSPKRIEPPGTRRTKERPHVTSTWGLLHFGPGKGRSRNGQNGMSSSMSSKPVDDLGAGAGAGRGAALGRATGRLGADGASWL